MVNQAFRALALRSWRGEPCRGVPWVTVYRPSGWPEAVCRRRPSLASCRYRREEWAGLHPAFVGGAFGKLAARSSGLSTAPGGWSLTESTRIRPAIFLSSIAESPCCFWARSAVWSFAWIAACCCCWRVCTGRHLHKSAAALVLPLANLEHHIDEFHHVDLPAGLGELDDGLIGEHFHQEGQGLRHLVFGRESCAGERRILTTRKESPESTSISTVRSASTLRISEIGIRSFTMRKTNLRKGRKTPSTNRSTGDCRRVEEA